MFRNPPLPAVDAWMARAKERPGNILEMSRKYQPALLRVFVWTFKGKKKTPPSTRGVKSFFLDLKEKKRPLGHRRCRCYCIITIIVIAAHERPTMHGRPFLSLPSRAQTQEGLRQRQRVKKGWLASALHGFRTLRKSRPSRRPLEILNPGARTASKECQIKINTLRRHTCSFFSRNCLLFLFQPMKFPTA